jgi:hypothetical protein
MIIEKGGSRWGHDGRRIGPNPNTNSLICHEQLAPLVQAAWFGVDSEVVVRTSDPRPFYNQRSGTIRRRCPSGRFPGKTAD